MIEVIEIILTIGFSAVALLAALGFVLFRHSVYSALSFATAVLAAAGLYILQNAAYVAAATMVIYAGATIIIFLFVLMFAQRSTLQQFELQYSNLGVALAASTCLVLLLGYAVSTRGDVAGGQPVMVSPATAQAVDAADDVDGENQAGASERAALLPASPAAVDQPGTSVADLGRVTYTRYLWSIELAGTLLLIAAGGAIIIAQREPHTAESTGVSAS